MDHNEQLKNFYNDVVQLLNDGKKEELNELIRQKFDQLPEDLQGEIMTRMVLQGFSDKVAEEDAIAAVQERGLELLGELDDV